METSPAVTPGLLDEIRGFLNGLRGDWPELFAPRRPAAPRARPPFPARPAPPPADGTVAARFHARTAHWAAAMGVEFGRIRVKDTKSRWGSCSPQGDINFNWRLTLAPPEVLDYVVIHELAHRLEMNHSRRFWAHVSTHCPDHRVHRRWLRKNGEALQRARRDGKNPDRTVELTPEQVIISSDPQRILTEMVDAGVSLSAGVIP